MTSLASKVALLQNLFLEAVSAVVPRALFANTNESIKLQSDRNVLIIGKKSEQQQQLIDITNKQCHLVGFGKAVLGMAVQIEQQLGDRLVSGVLSVPVGTAVKFLKDPDMQLRAGSVVQVFEGARDNLPDDRAAENAVRILDKCRQMTRDDVLIVLISGGGSSLLPLPIAPVTIEEKRNLIRQLASRQATINEINTVRIRLSQTKGGKLAIAARNAYRCVSLVLSDVCGDPLDIIASGPTFKTSLNLNSPLDILNKYELTNEIPESILQVLTKDHVEIDFPTNSSINIIGNNQMACAAIQRGADNQGMKGIVISTEVIGSVSDLSLSYVKLLQLISEFRDQQIELTDWKNALKPLQIELNFKSDAADVLTDYITSNRCNCTPFLIIAGGEPTVQVTGNGIGGRNQELALRMSVLLSEIPTLQQVMMISAGTDGIDGPTTAAGAIGCSQVVADAISSNLDLNSYLKNNDSFTFYSQLMDGKYHVVTGHTGTNVMDVHIFIV